MSVIHPQVVARVHYFKVEIDPDLRGLCVSDLELTKESQSLAFDFTYRMGMGIWVQKGGRKVNLAFMLASILGHGGQVIHWAFVPT